VSDDIKAAHRELSDRLMGRRGIAGVAIGERSGQPCLKVYVTAAAAGRGVPKRVGSFPVVVETTGSFRRL